MSWLLLSLQIVNSVNFRAAALLSGYTVWYG